MDGIDREVTGGAARAESDEAASGAHERLRAREQFYRRYGGGARVGNGRAEVDFLRWAADRGVFGADGSPWWKAVNARFTARCERARALFDAGERTHEDREIAAWLAYFAAPTGVRWYRAHNRGIVRAYLAERALAEREPASEQLFVNVVLARLLATQALNEGALIGSIGRWFAHPRLPLVRALVAQRALHPRGYPMSEQEHRAFVRCFDRTQPLSPLAAEARSLDRLLALHLREVFEIASELLEMPALRAFVRDDALVYPYLDGPPTSQRAPRATRPAPRSRPTRVAILGGGLGSLAAAYELTQEPDWQQRYEITVYQMGWRLGGKMSGGRGVHERIEELGLHLLLGFYHRAFAMFRAVYRERAERGLAPSCPFQRLDDALVPNNSLLFVEHLEDEQRWVNWPITVPERAGRPGDGDPAPHESLGLALALLWQYVRGPSTSGPRASLAFRASALGGLALTPLIRAMIERLAALVAPGARAALSQRAALVAVIDAAHAALARVDRGAYASHAARRAATALDLLCALAKGVLRDVLREDGSMDVRAINDRDFRQWLREHGARERTLRSALVTFFYNASFNNRPADGERGGVLAAGTALQFLLLGAGFRGSIFYQLRLGTADTLVMPLYQVLAARGVKFAFFHRVTGLSLSEDGARIGRVELERQVEPADERVAYDPIQWTRAGSAAWPGEPRWEWIAEPQREALRARARRGESLESPALHGHGAAVAIELGRDFDEVVIGIPPAGLRPLFRELLARDPDARRRARWRAMFDAMRSVQVMSAQLWFDRSSAALGLDPARWGLAAERALPNVVTYADPVFSWLAQDHFVEGEAWPAHARPRFVAAFTNSIDDDPTQTPGAQARAVMRAWLPRHFAWFVPQTRRGDGSFAFDTLVASPTADGDALDQQWFFASDNPSDRYVLAAPGADSARIAPEDSGFANAVLVGDWTDFGANFGFMEGTIQSAERAVRALRSRVDPRAPY